MKVTPAAIEGLWFAQGTAADAASCVNKYSDEHYTPDMIRKVWTKAQEEGRLPDLDRGTSGFQGFMAPLMKRFGEIIGRRANV